jgi:hypothetical protein
MITFNEWLIQEGKGGKGKNMKDVTPPKDKSKYSPVTGEVDASRIVTGHREGSGATKVYGPTKNNKRPRKKKWDAEE